MNSLNVARQGKSAARQIKAQMDSGVLTQPELARLMKKVIAGFEEMVPAAMPLPEATQLGRRGAFEVVRGDRP